MIAGQKKARLRRKTNMPTTPTLKRPTDSSTDDASNKRVGEITKQRSPRRLAQDILPRPEGRQAACRAFSNGLTWIACHAGCTAASTATATPLPNASAKSPGESVLLTRSMTENKLRTV